MKISIDHPTGRPNFSEVTIGGLTVWFSYKTPIAFYSIGSGYVISENTWGPTTGKHLNAVVAHDKARRVKRAEFEAALDAEFTLRGIAA